MKGLSLDVEMCACRRSRTVCVVRLDGVSQGGADGCDE